MLVALIIVAVVISLVILTALLQLFVKKGLKHNPVRFARAMIGLLFLQFALGMVSNLYATIPKEMPWLVFHEVGPILVHSALGTCLLILAVLFLVDATKRARDMMPAIIALSSIAASFACGVIFVNLGQNDISSLLMSLGFITALTAYCYVAFRSDKATKRRVKL
jgi:heme A synthase